jgi:hypothetical protein
METLDLAMLDHYVPDVPEQVRLGEGTLPKKPGEPGHHHRASWECEKDGVMISTFSPLPTASTNLPFYPTPLGSSEHLRPCLPDPCPPSPPPPA